MRLRNTTDETYRDHLTQLVAAPDEVIEVDDDLAEFYDDHPVWAEVPAMSPSKKEDQ